MVPARGGSKGIPGKNLQSVAGISLVGRAVVTGRQFLARSGVDGVVLVDTDSADIAEEGRRWGGEVPFLRPPELARDDTRTEENVTLAIQRMAQRIGAIDGVVLLQPTSPLRTVVDVLSCWELFHPPDVPAVVTVAGFGHPVEYAVRLANDGTFSWASGVPPGSFRRQDHAAAFTTNGAVYVATPETVERRAMMTAGVTRLVTMPAGRSLDVDSLQDLALVRAAAQAVSSVPMEVGGRALGGGHRCLVLADLRNLSSGEIDRHRHTLDAIHNAGVDGVICPRLDRRSTVCAAVREAALLRVTAAATTGAFGDDGPDGVTVSAQFTTPALAREIGKSAVPIFCELAEASILAGLDVAECTLESAGRMAYLCSHTKYGVMKTVRFLTEAPVGWVAKSLEDAVGAVTAGAEILVVPFAGGSNGEGSERFVRDCTVAVRERERALGFDA